LDAAGRGVQVAGGRVFGGDAADDGDAAAAVAWPEFTGKVFVEF
jgi:hypothetical protein